MLTFTTAGDYPSRDPLSFTLYGSAVTLAGTGPFALNLLTLITAGESTGLSADPGRESAGIARSIANTTPYDSYLLVFPTVRDSDSANSMQIGEINFESVPIPEASTWAAVGTLLLISGACLRRNRGKH